MSLPLTGTTVVDLSSGVAGGYCTKILVDGGAHVVKVEDPAGGDPLRRRTRTSAPLAEGEDGAVFRYLTAGKEGVALDDRDPADVALLHELVASADLIVWGPGSRLADLHEFRPAGLRAAAPHAVVVSVTPFGLDGPWVDRPSTDFTLQALGGAQIQRGSIKDPPLMAGSRPSEWATGMFAAAGALAAWTRARRTGNGELLDVSALESCMLSQNVFPVIFRSMAGFPIRPVRQAQFPNVHPTSDGFVSLQVVTGQQWLDFCVMVEQFDWADDADMMLMSKRAAMIDDLQPAVDAWTSARTTDEVVELAAAFRLPVAPVGTGETVPGLDHVVARDMMTRNPSGDFVQPRAPWRIDGEAAPEPGPTPALGEHTDRYRTARPRRIAAVPDPDADPTALPFAGLKVLDMTAFWAGPIIAHLLAILGAEVVHVESPSRPDGIRMNAVRPMTEPQWWEYAPFFQGTNTNKRGLAIDLQTERARAVFRDLVRQADVVVENYSPRVLGSWGLTREALAELNPRLIFLRAPAFGTDGPWADRVAYAHTVESAAGLAALTGYPDGRPEPEGGYGDPVGGTHASIALMLALLQREQTGRGAHVEIPMLGGSLALGAEPVVEWSAYGRRLERYGNQNPQAVPQDLFRCADEGGDEGGDTWVAVAVETDEQWAALRKALDEPAWAADPALDHLPGRQAAADTLHAELASYAACFGVDELVERLSSAGVPAERVWRNFEHDQIPQVLARGLYEQVEHPLLGTYPNLGYPVKFGNGPTRIHRRHAPLLGEHNTQVLQEWLGLTDEEVAALAEEGIIGTTIRSGRAV